MVWIQTPPLIREQAVTPERVFWQRRRFLVAGAAAMGGTWLSGTAFSATLPPDIPDTELKAALTPLSTLESYNNYTEFSTDKKAVRHLAQALTTHPWTVHVEGEVENSYVFDMDDLKGWYGMEERVYRFRCVEGWSMVVPWNGIPLSKLIERARPTSRARFVEFVSLLRPSEMIGQRTAIAGLQWPYREGLRIDEAMHPLTLAVTGVYGAPLPKQNGAPLRIIVPWKYAFKSPKAITHIRLVAEQPQTSWHQAAPNEYGFYGNVNPDLAHPRWSQARETRMGETRKRPTLYLNGYANQVSALYAGMSAQDLY